MSYQQARHVPKGFLHLESTLKNKFVTKYPSKSPRPPTAFVKPEDRVPRWNIVPGDKVRLLVGKPEEKFQDGVKANGWRMYDVVAVDVARNRLYLDGLANKKGSIIRPMPENLEQMDEEEQKQWKEQKNFVDVRRPVQYSNVQLCVEDKGPLKSVFATRISTSAMGYNAEARRHQWSRFASRLTGDTSIPVHPKRQQVMIPWPDYSADKKPVPPSTLDTVEQYAAEPTLALGDARSIPQSITPTSMRAPAPKDQGWADEYIFQAGARPDARMQAAMPLYLSEELGPRFARSKRQKGWRERREMEAFVRETTTKEELEAWEAGGRDAGIEEVLSTDLVGLDGAKIRNRTRQEIREGTEAEFDADLQKVKRDVRVAVRAGKLFDYDNGMYVLGPKAINIERKRARKARKQAKIIQRLERLNLKDAKNQVIPQDLRS